MGWDRGRYYTRSRKVGGRVVREYLGKGPLAKMAAQLDALGRAVREEQRRARADLDALEADFKALADLTDLAARAALVAAGFRRHKRGEWRKRRGTTGPAA